MKDRESTPDGSGKEEKERGDGLPLKGVVYSLFFASGASALVYEVIWARHLQLVFGDTVFAVTTVLAAFMAGLGLGGVLFGRYIDTRRSSALKVYAVLEIGIGLYALVFPFLLEFVTPLCVWLIERYRADFLTTSIFRFTLCFFIMLPATTFMGGTLPVLSRYFVRRLSLVGGGVGVLYGINTLGAVTGCLLPAFVLIARFGVRNTTFLAVAVNVLIGLTVLALSRGDGEEEGDGEGVHPVSEGGEKATPGALVSALPWLFMVSGCAALSYEVLWTRLLIYVVGLDIQAFSIMLAIFLSGLTLGSFLYSRFLQRYDPLTVFLFLEMGIGLGAVLSVPLFRAFSLALRESLYDLETTPWTETILIRFAQSILVMLLPTTAMGATFPAAARLAVRRLGGVGSKVGVLYGLNTAGGILGAMAGGFVVIPVFGIQRGILLTAVLNFLVAAAVLLFAPSLFRRRPVVRGLSAVLAATALILVPALHFSDRPIVVEAEGTEGKKVLYYEEGASTSISVLEDPGTGVREVNVNGMSLAFTDYWDFKVQKMLAHLPILLHEDPRTIMMVAFGSGGSSGAAALHGLPVDGVELEEAQKRTAPYFRFANHDVLNPDRFPNYRLHIDDGRNWLLSRSRRYDVISRDTLPPKRSQDLFSREFYELTLSRLAPGGVACAFLPTDLCFDERRFLKIVRTFGGVFPHTSLWYVGPEFLLLIGSRQELKIDYRRLAERMSDPPVKEDLQVVNLGDPLSLLSCFLMTGKELEEFHGPGEVITDDRPIGFVNAREHLAAGHNLIITERILRHRTRVRPYLHNLGSSPEEGAAVEAELEKFFAANEHLIRGRAVQMEGDFTGAISAYRRAVEIHPSHGDAWYNLARALAGKGERELEEGDPSGAMRLVEEALEITAEEGWFHVLLGRIHESKGDGASAARSYRRALEIREDKGYPPIPLAAERLSALSG